MRKMIKKKNKMLKIYHKFLMINNKISKLQNKIFKIYHYLSRINKKIRKIKAIPKNKCYKIRMNKNKKIIIRLKVYNL